jgi:hypothetical protein
MALAWPVASIDKSSLDCHSIALAWPVARIDKSSQILVFHNDIFTPKPRWK